MLEKIDSLRKRETRQTHTFSKDGYQLTDNWDRFDANTAHGLLRQSYWSLGVPLETMQKAAKNSWTFSLISPASDFVGMSRFVTDYATFAYLADVIIAPEHRGLGLGHWMMTTLHELPEIRACRRVFLMTADAHELYSRQGYKPLALAERAMEIHRPDIYRGEDR